ncbi:hypothetical protein [Enterococcus canintestini]|uniref:hypothetical protein n=1 Tax=Enterococcus canintestini TaxID=317010 RepID=UPI002891A4EA|nr:hypothetical protein [Enterococcus canintestini]MDT2738880.1 hypothetical protein [Enterococcus canintestini]
MKAKVFKGYRDFPERLIAMGALPVQDIVVDYINNGCSGTVKHITESETHYVKHSEFGPETIITVWYEEDK